MPNGLEIQGIITEVKTAPDGGVRVKLDVNELSPEGLFSLFSLKGDFLKLTIQKDG